MKRVKMSRENRAKQFMPFAALTGHREVLSLREKTPERKSELSDEMKEELNWKIQQLTRGSMVTVEYFDKDKYLTMDGMVARIDFVGKTIQVVNKIISFDDIRQLDCDDF